MFNFKNPAVPNMCDSAARNTKFSGEGSAYFPTRQPIANLIGLFFCQFFMNWRRNNSLNRPSKFYSRVENIRSRAQKLSPLGDAPGFTTVGEQVVLPSVSRLFSGGGPSAVVGLIVAVLVWVSINGMAFCWANAHINDKVFEAVTARPSLAHGNASPTIIGVSIGRWASAAAKHLPPNVVIRMVGFATDDRVAISHDIASYEGSDVVRADDALARFAGSFYCNTLSAHS